MEQLLADQQLLSKQIDATGQAMAKLTLNRGSASGGGGRPPSPASSEEQAENQFHHRRTTGDTHTRSGFNSYNHQNEGGFNSYKHQNEGGGFSRLVVPKLSCPRFEGSNPRIWKDKCIDYFRICNVPDSMWPLVASLHMDGVASGWVLGNNSWLQ